MNISLDLSDTGIESVQRTVAAADADAGLAILETMLASIPGRATRQRLLSMSCSTADGMGPSLGVHFVFGGRDAPRPRTLPADAWVYVWDESQGRGWTSVAQAGAAIEATSTVNVYTCQGTEQAARFIVPGAAAIDCLRHCIRSMCADPMSPRITWADDTVI
jgi:MinD-like ATPase involved in chromosome partitioning or flagellar assembly